MLLALVLGLAVAPPQASPNNDVWRHVHDNQTTSPEANASLTADQVASIQHAIAVRMEVDGSCSRQDVPDLIQNLTYEDLAVSSNRKITLVVAGTGCARGGQGANGAMWVVTFSASRVRFLATPQQQLSGWLYSIQPGKSNGLRDIVLGWHMSAAETDLSYFRFNGRFYVRTAQAVETNDATGDHIVPATGTGPVL